MRLELAKLNQTRTRFRATVDRFGSRENIYTNCFEDTILLKDICKAGDDQILTDHVWFSVGKRMAELNLEPNDVIEFDVRVSEYVKGYYSFFKGIDNRELDYKLSHPTNFQKVNQKDKIYV